MTVPEELLSLRGEMRELRQRVARAERSNAQLRAGIATRDSELAFLRTDNARFAKENKELKERLDDTTNHKNTLAGMIFKPSLKEKPHRERSIGGQLGHVAHHRPEPKIDARVHVYLARCPHCGKKVDRCHHTYTRVVEDIAPVSPVIATEYTIEKQRCTSCHASVSATPQGTLPHTIFGVNLLSHVLSLRYELRLPMNRIKASLLRDHALSLSEGTIENMLHRTRNYFSEMYQETLEDIRAAPRKHADETSWRTNGQNGWAWLFATDTAALYTFEETRGKGVPERILEGSPPDSLLTCDDYSAYTNLPLKRQSCWSHLTCVAQDGESAEARTLATRLGTLFKELSDITQTPFVLKRRKLLHAQYARTIQSVINEQCLERDTKKIYTRIRNQGNHLIEALLHEGAHLTNNHAERQIRPLAVLRKITGGSRSRRGAETTARNMTIMQTLKLRGTDLMIGLHTLLTVSNQKFVREG
jgi:transposase